jgi:nitrogen fixation protein FixH
MLRWTAIILCLLCGSVSMWIYAAVLAVSDPSMAVVPDYHEKALQWDQQLAVNASSRALGWTVHAIPGPRAREGVKRQLTLFLRDAASQPVSGGAGQLRLYHHARAGLAESVPLEESSPGAYEAQVTMNRPGYWQLELRLQRGDERFEWTAEQSFTDLP